MTRSVVLRTAYAWDCDECGRENFERAIVSEMSPEDLQWMRQEHGLEDWQTGDFVTMPETVVCPHCGAEFATEHYSDDEG